MFLKQLFLDYSGGNCSDEDCSPNTVQTGTAQARTSQTVHRCAKRCLAKCAVFGEKFVNSVYKLFVHQFGSPAWL